MAKLLYSTIFSIFLGVSLHSVAQESVDDFLREGSATLKTGSEVSSGPILDIPDFDIEAELLPELPGKQILNIDEKSVVIDLPEPIKGQNHSIIPWSELDTSEWLSIESWLVERKVKDNIPDWKIRLRETDHKELMGKILSCFGECLVYRGSRPATVQHLSRIKEGDELVTGKNSVAWVFMLDGSLMRVSPGTSVSFQETNISAKEIFILARLNQGHLFWHPRLKDEALVVEGPETDTLSIPLMVREANEAYFERQIFKAQNDQGRLIEVMSLEERAIREQFKALNELRKKNSSSIFQPTRFMLVAPNATLMSMNQGFDHVYLPGGASYFKKREPVQGELSLYLRGYKETDASAVTDDLWFEVSADGRMSSALEDVPGPLQILELLTRRIKSIELAREIWTSQFTVPMLSSIENAENLAQEYGYKVWGDELARRLDFLLEYTRRVETTHLRSLDNLLDKLETKGDFFRQDLSEDLYRESLNHYLLGLKARYSQRSLRVREMNDLQYYVWILTRGQF